MHLGQLSLLSLRGRQIEHRPVWLELKQSVWLQCVVCDLRQVMSRTSEMARVTH